MKKQVLSALFISVFLFVTSGIQAQNVILNLQGYNEQPYHFGFILGMNTMNFSVKTIDQVGTHLWTKEQAPDLPNADYYRVLSVTASASPGFSVGILGNLRLMKFVDLRFIPTLSFGSRSLNYSISGSGMAGAPAGVDSVFTVDKKVNSTYLTFPLLIKYRSWRKDNYGAYLIGGINYSIDLAAKKPNLDNGETGTGDILLNSHDVNAEIGAGFDFYNAYFKLSVEAKMIFGLKNLVVDDNTLYSGSIDQLHSKIFMLSFTFE
ncbi:PorT family protein [Candidatus Sulfidibacterium hydrothermale]|uniref:type IX secretion/gliding motility protein PorT/SprT n=1 Tax=Candidatus Sulfidibacterium hydrothermale TaxID=2875962 RepID=UPI001F0B5E1E|nr:porin family protein [Candidatus Sulfidibacterium hydrothermale]UBM61492.1 PorT family protein [Candidatus Sulfidibacterium hydrothermale]